MAILKRNFFCIQKTAALIMLTGLVEGQFLRMSTEIESSNSTISLGGLACLGFIHLTVTSTDSVYRILKVGRIRLFGVCSGQVFLW